MLLGIDLGTTSIKAVVLDPGGNIAASASQEYESLYPRSGWVEQALHVWRDTVVQVIRLLWQEKPGLAALVRAIGFSGQMHGAVFLDAHANPLRPAVIWADGRSQPQVVRVQQQFGEAYSHLTGNPLLTGFMLPTILWIREHEPEIWQRCRKILLPKDYLRYLFTGQYLSEASDASSTGLFDIARRTWSEDVLDGLDLDSNLLPDLTASTSVAGTLLPEMAGQLGLRTGIPVICGGSDQACQALGNGIINPGEVSCTIGTGGQVFAPLGSPLADHHLRLHLFCHILPDLWHLESATLSAGLSLRWLRGIMGDLSYTEMADLADQSPVGSGGLFFAPYLQGERTPYMDAQVRGGFVGLSIHHARKDLVRAVMEGVVFSLRTGMEIMLERIPVPSRLVASGGACRHPLWLHLLADIFSLPVVTSTYPESASVGAAMLAGIGTGMYSNAAVAVQRVVRYSQPILPDPQNVKAYQQVFLQHKLLYVHLRPFSHNQL